jgi:hypothetical protein
MSIDVEMFELILTSGFCHAWDSMPIPRQDVPEAADPRPECRSLDAPGVLGLTLHWLTSTMQEVTLQEVFTLVTTTVSCYISFGLKHLLQTLKALLDTSICWLLHQEFAQLQDLITQCHPLLTGTFGSIDGLNLNLPCQVSEDEEIKNATYNGWFHAHFISSVLALHQLVGVLTLEIVYI